MPRFYCPEPLNKNVELNLPGDAARHVQVLRMQPGQSITLFPGNSPDSNYEYTATILEMGRQHVKVQVNEVSVADRENLIRVRLLAGIPANDRMDWLVEKATELGVSSITPIVTERCVVRLKSERAIKKQQHWQAIAISACEQSGRNTVPTIDAIQSFDAWQAKQSTAAQSAFLVLTPENAKLGLAQWITDVFQQTEGDAMQNTMPKNVYVLTGPEGGLSPRELEQAISMGFVPVSLGSRVLRSETAPLAALALLGLM